MYCGYVNTQMQESLFLKLLPDGSAQLILAAAGGGGASDQLPSVVDAAAGVPLGSPDARGLLPPSLPLRDLLRLVPRGDDDAGEPL